MDSVLGSGGEKTQSDSIKELTIALVKVQGVIEGAVRDSENPFFRSRYADLSSVWNACRKPLSDNGLAVIQTMGVEGTTSSCDTLVTTLVHTSGEWIRGSMRLHPVKLDPQGQGSAMTYARRYSLAAIVGIAPEDDDAELAMGREKRETGATEEKRELKGETMSPLGSKKQKDLLVRFMESSKMTGEEREEIKDLLGNPNTTSKQLSDKIGWWIPESKRRTPVKPMEGEPQQEW